MPPVGLEPTHLTAQVPKTCMSTNFITGAHRANTQYMLSKESIQKLGECVKNARGYMLNELQVYFPKRRRMNREGTQHTHFMILSSLNPYYVLFQIQGRHEQIKNLLDMLLRIAYTQHNLPFAVQMRFDWLYNHPMVPFLTHRLGRHVRTAYIQYTFDKFLRHVT